MTAIAQPRRASSNPLAGLLLVAALFGGIVGGAVAVVVPSIVDSRADAAAAEAALWARYGEAWETRYRQMYPNS